ncbi:hypothetical protein DPMN_103209 [Dreissena polymorpha]|uniref:Uncharacterized protein n=1 Tax=Dreissena polymorpha TaxID=45954 RepID=A0A9D4H7M1_DREPO|nr:hypothetical protein DPMN_103209 [Dreissena polymorpha]
MKNKMGSTDDLRKIGHCDVAGLQKKMSYDVSDRHTERQTYRVKDRERKMFKEKVNARTHGSTHARRTQDHDISPACLWPVELKTKKGLICAYETKDLNPGYSVRKPHLSGMVTTNPTHILLETRIKP